MILPLIPAPHDPCLCRKMKSQDFLFPSSLIHYIYTYVHVLWQASFSFYHTFANSLSNNISSDDHVIFCFKTKFILSRIISVFSTHSDTHTPTPTHTHTHTHTLAHLVQLEPSFYPETSPLCSFSAVSELCRESLLTIHVANNTQFIRRKGC